MPLHSKVSVDLKALASNVSLLVEHIRPAKLCAVIKMDAYGHGIKDVAPVIVSNGAAVLSICTNDEVRDVREGAKLSTPLFRCRVALPEEHEEVLHKGWNVEEMIGNTEGAHALSTLGLAYKCRVPCHINLDTTMGRQGFSVDDIDTIKNVISLPGIRVVGCMTHFSSSDGASIDETRTALDRFKRTVEQLPLPRDGCVLHTANSAATLRMRETHLDMVRCGAAVFGNATSLAVPIRLFGLRPVMSWKSSVAQVRRVAKGTKVGYSGMYVTDDDEEIAGIPVGFGEGYPRALANRGIVLIRGVKCPVRGRISCNMMTVGVSHVGGVSVGDEVVLIGKQGNEEITFEELGELFDSVHTEIQMGIAGHSKPYQIE